MHPETKREATLKQFRSADSAERQKRSFVDDTAAKTGRSSRVIEQEVQIATNIIPEVKEALADNQIK